MTIMRTMFEVDKVAEFWKARNKKLGKHDQPELDLASRLFFEEAHELLEAIDEYKAEENNTELEDVLKEICDVVYVVHAVTVAMGLEDKFQAAFNIVHNNNMQKIVDGTVNEYGKLVKSPDHPSVKPALKGLINNG